MWFADFDCWTLNLGGLDSLTYFWSLKLNASIFYASWQLKIPPTDLETPTGVKNFHHSASAFFFKTNLILTIVGIIAT
jgi:hypothetical protein